MSQESPSSTSAEGGAQVGSDPSLEATAASAPARPGVALEATLDSRPGTPPVPGQSGLEATRWDATADATLVASSAAGAGAGSDAAAGAGPGAEAGAADPLVGRTLHHFRILGPIGAGGMGRVYRAHDLSLDRPVALKVIAEAVSRDAEQRDRFVREARAQAKLSHPNVVSIYYVGEQDEQLFFAMELVEGEALDAPLQRGERLPWPEALAAVIAAGEALHLAHHRGVVHRDVKPSNLLRDPSGLVKIADFGLARLGVGVGQGATGPGGEEALAITALDGAPVVPGTPLPGGSGPGSSGHGGSGSGATRRGSGTSGGGGNGSDDAQLTRAGAVLGSPLYLSPEQADGQPADHRSDMYSLGATLFHLVAGRPVFEAKSAAGVIGMHLAAPVPSLRRVAPEARVPERLDRVVRRLLAKRPEDRFATWEEALDALRAAQPQAVAKAGFWVRSIAYLVDYGLMSIPVALLGWPGLALAGAYFVLGWWLFGRTLGKWLFRLRVRTDENERLTLPRALLRLVCQYWIVGVALLIGLVTWSVYGKGQLNLNDPDIAKHRVLAIVLIVLISVAMTIYAVGLLWAGIRGHKAAWHDLWSRTRVVYDLPESGVEYGSRAAASAWASGARTTVMDPRSRGHGSR